MKTVNTLTNNDPTEPRWTCANGHSCSNTTNACTMPGCGATR